MNRWGEILSDGEQPFNKFRRALRREDQIILDELMARARPAIEAGGHQLALGPMEVVLLSMLIGHRQAITELREKLERINGATA